MNSGIKFLLIQSCLVIALAACNEKPAPTNTQQDKISFSIPNTTEEVILKHPDGTHHVSRFKDNATGEKVAEVEFHPNGQPKIHKHFEQEILQGESWCYYEDGKPWSLNTFRDGKYEGIYKTWFENGQLHISGQYINGLEEGEWFTYYQNGQLNTRGMYKQGKKSGLWTSYNLEGTLKREQNFEE